MTITLVLIIQQTYLAFTYPPTVEAFRRIRHHRSVFVGTLR